MSSPNSVQRQRWRNRDRALVWLSAAALGCSAAVGVGIAPAIADTPTALTGVILGVGSNEAQRIVTWYSSTDSAETVQLAPTASLVGGQFPTAAATFSAIGAANIATSGGYNRHATISGLVENTAYSYRVGFDGNWSSTYAFTTQSFDGPFDFLFYGDRRSDPRATWRRTAPAGSTR